MNLLSKIMAFTIIFLVVSCAGTQQVKKTQDTLPLAEKLLVFHDSTMSEWHIEKNLQKSKAQFSDRAFLVSELPDYYAGSEYIFTPADAKTYTGDILVRFKVNEKVDLYIAHDSRITIKPDWMKDWEKTKDSIVNNEKSPTTFNLFKKTYEAGSNVTLGPNGQSGGALMYMIILKKPGQPGRVEKIAAETYIPDTCDWPNCIELPTAWYKTDNGIAVGDNLLAYQKNNGGWPKNINMALDLSSASKEAVIKSKSAINDSTIDNDATTNQIIYLGKLYTATKLERFKEGALLGINYLLDAQYPNGGWPQFYPVDPDKYHARITYNDDAMTNVLELFDLILVSPYFEFIDKSLKNKIIESKERAIDVILKTQIVVNGKKTAWCAQHDEKTLLPALARSYELPSISGSESVAVARYLMTIENPSKEIIDSIQSAAAWFDEVRIDNIIVIDIDDPEKNGGKDRVVEEHKGAPPIWGRFYDLETNKAFFSGRDGIKKENLADIEHERRMGYRYYVSTPLNFLKIDYPKCQKKYAPNNNVLKNDYNN